MGGGQGGVHSEGQKMGEKNVRKYKSVLFISLFTEQMSCWCRPCVSTLLLCVQPFLAVMSWDQTRRDALTRPKLKGALKSTCDFGFFFGFDLS